MRFLVICTVFSSLFILGCQTKVEPATHVNNKENTPVVEVKSSSEVAMSFTGKVTYLPIEGGFWGIITDDHKQLDGPIPEQLQVEGLRVKGSYQILKDTFSFRMWGDVVTFVELSKE